MFRQALVLQFASTAFCPVTRHHWKSLTALFAPSLEVFIHTDEVPPESSPSWTVPTLSASGDAPVPSSSLWDSIHYIQVSLILGRPELPELDPTFQLWFHQCWVVVSPTQHSGNTSLDPLAFTMSYLFFLALSVNTWSVLVIFSCYKT